MIAAKDFVGSHSSEQFPNSRKVYTTGKIFSGLRVPSREISLSSTKSVRGGVEENAAVRVYDTSGPWSDPRGGV